MKQPLSKADRESHKNEYYVKHKKNVDFTERFLKDGFTLTRMNDNGKYYDVFVRESIQVVGGVRKLIKEAYPVVEKDIDLYVTGYYKEKRGKHKGRVNTIELRVPIRVTFALNPEYVDDFKNELKEKAEESFAEWLVWEDIEIVPDEIKSEFHDGIE